MRILKDGTLDRDAEHAKLLIGKYEKLLNTAVKMGFGYNDDIVTLLHNERAYWINKVSQYSDDKLVTVIWKNGSVHIYDRVSYCNHKYGHKRRINGSR